MISFDEQLQHLITEALQEDVGNGDHSSLSCIAPGKTGKAVLKIKQYCILAGMNVAGKIFRYKENFPFIPPFKKAGERIDNWQTAF